MRLYAYCMDVYTHSFKPINSIAIPKSNVRLSPSFEKLIR